MEPFRATLGETVRMTRIEFAKMAEQAKKRDNKLWLYWLIIFFAILIINIPVASYIDTLNGSIGIYYLIGFFGLLFGNLYLIFRVSKNRNERSGLVCQFCNNTFSTVGIELAIATGNCSSCGKKFLEN